jgi:hypothetical protein
VRTVRLAILLAFTAPTLLASTASADPFVIGAGNGSAFILDFEGDFFRFAGDGFSINQNSIGVFPERLLAPICTFCQPGDTLDMSYTSAGNDVFLGTGNATIGATRFDDVSFRGSLTFDATPITFPSRFLDPFFVFPAAPVTFSGTVRGLVGANEVFAASIIGKGLVGQPFFFNGTAWEWEEGRRNYVFGLEATNPTPEPSTLLMFGFGAAALSRMRRRGTNTHSPNDTL